MSRYLKGLIGARLIFLRFKSKTIKNLMLALTLNKRLTYMLRNITSVHLLRVDLIVIVMKLSFMDDESCNYKEAMVSPMAEKRKEEMER